MRPSLVTLMIGLSALTGGEAFAQAGHGPLLAGIGAPAEMARTVTFDVSGEAGPFRVLVFAPDTPPPAEGYGIIYAMDAGWTFGTLRDAQIRLAAGPEGAARPTVIVAIGWPTGTLVDLARRGPDLTGSGAAATLDTLVTKIVPRVEAALPANPARRMIVGHSFGGAFALRAGLGRPDLFSHIAAGSPSVWTDPDWFLKGAPVGGHNAALVTVGALETAAAAEAAGEPADRVARFRERDMTGRAQAMADRLGVPLTVLDAETHGSSIAPFLTRAVDFLWR